MTQAEKNKESLAVAQRDIIAAMAKYEQATGNRITEIAITSENFGIYHPPTTRISVQPW